MASNFRRDHEKAKIAEHLVWEVLCNTDSDFDFEEVGDNPEWYYHGDIRAINELDNIEVGVEVKNDSRIADTQNVLIEVKVWSYKENRYLKPNLESNYDYYAVVAQQINTIYIMDWNVLKRIYKQGKPYTKDHYDDNGRKSQKTIGTLVNLGLIKRNGGLLYTIKYNNEHKPIEIKSA